jgi:uncharacterized protein YeaC (DUF1315 family)
MSSLREDITALVDQRLHDARETGKIIDARKLASEMAESLADMLVCSAPPEEHAGLVAHVLTVLNRFLQDKRKTQLGARVQ